MRLLRKTFIFVFALSMLCAVGTHASSESIQDSDSDGVRDDVQRYILETIDDQAQQRALLNIAKIVQNMIIDYEDKHTVIQHARRLGQHIECLFHLNPSKASELIETIEGLHVDTEANFIAYMKANDQLSGETFLSSGVDNFKYNCE